MESFLVCERVRWECYTIDESAIDYGNGLIDAFFYLVYIIYSQTLSTIIPLESTNWLNETAGKYTHSVCINDRFAC